MAPPLPDDLREFLRLLGVHHVDYLLVGGWAVAHYGVARTTADMDVWIRMTARNAERLVDALKEFGFNVPELDKALFLKRDAIVRLGRPPLRIEILTSISGVKFAPCFRRRNQVSVAGVKIPVIGLDDLKQNKRAAGRPKDIEDLRHLP